MLSSTASSAYPSPPARHYSAPFEHTITNTMGGESGERNIDGVGVLTYQRAVDIARNAEGDLDPNVSEYLEDALKQIWSRIRAEPESYILTNDEFAVFNFYVRRFEGQPEAQPAIDRYWRNASAPSASRN